ncbi:hypothetical protein CR513_59483, partial [Mucuna pruriens]
TTRPKGERTLIYNCEHSFQTLKVNLTRALVLVLSDLSKPLVVYCDTSRMCIGGVLTVVAYASRQLKIHERNYPTHDLELAAVVMYDPVEKKLVRSQDVQFMEDQTIEDIDEVKKTTQTIVCLKLIQFGSLYMIWTLLIIMFRMVSNIIMLVISNLKMILMFLL